MWKGAGAVGIVVVALNYMIKIYSLAELADVYECTRERRIDFG